jgi:DNA-binding NarL/FixJ family response regulator
VTEPIRVLLADDHPSTRAGVRLALEGQGFLVCAEAEDAAGAVEAAVRERPDLCVLDIGMPGSGIAAAAEIGELLPEIPVVMLTVSTNEEDLFAALRVGARGYLLKDTNPERLPLALRGVLEGEAALPRTLVTLVIEEFGKRARRRRLLNREHFGPEARLTEREWDVLELLREGLATAEIGERLSISPVTVRRHVSEILRKLKVPSREAALRLLEEPVAG